ncbi:MAG: GNAT family N-acetyltransferase [Aliishimia sp.]
MQDFSIELASFEAPEADRLGAIFYDAVREGAVDFYSLEQRRAWMPKPPSGPKWASRLASQATVVARKDGLPVGFMTLDDDGYIDLAFVSPKYQRQGIGGCLYAQIEAMARNADIARLHSQASYLVKGLFEQHGWEVVCKQQVERAGVKITNFLMEKHLHDATRSGGILSN